MSDDYKELKGLGGWLILVGIGVVFTPVIIARDFLKVLNFFFENNWEMLIDPNSEIYQPQLFYFICAEFVANLLLLIASIYALYLFFSRHYKFPNFYICLIFISFLVVLLDAIILSNLIPEAEAFNQSTIMELVKAIIRMCIWIPYLLVSVRVKNTFIEKRNA